MLRFTIVMMSRLGIKDRPRCVNLTRGHYNTYIRQKLPISTPWDIMFIHMFRNIRYTHILWNATCYLARIKFTGSPGCVIGSGPGILGWRLSQALLDQVSCYIRLYSYIFLGYIYSPVTTLYCAMKTCKVTSWSQDSGFKRTFLVVDVNS